MLKLQIKVLGSSSLISSFFCVFREKGGGHLRALTFSLWMILDESASLMQPLSGPLEASSVSTTFVLSFLLILPSSSSISDFLLDEEPP